jgi:competence protein CoiA
MRYATLDGQRIEAAPGLRASCSACGAVVIGKCGEQRVWHWAHRGLRDCDPWWERETEWHRAWKAEFPSQCQEVVQKAPDGQKHVADVKTSHGIVIEFQHSHLPPYERRARETFYRRMVWVVDGTRLKNGAPHFFRTIEEGAQLSDPLLKYLVQPRRSALLKTWVESTVPVFLDFGVADVFASSIGERLLWRIDRNSSQAQAHVMPILRTEFIRAVTSGDKFKGIEALTAPAAVVSPQLAQSPLVGFEQYSARQALARKRF